jgi:transposase-like protein
MDGGLSSRACGGWPGGGVVDRARERRRRRDGGRLDLVSGMARFRGRLGAWSVLYGEAGRIGVHGEITPSSEAVPAGLRREAVELLRTSGRPLAELAHELGVSTESLRLWRKQGGDRRRRARGVEHGGASAAARAAAAGQLRRRGAGVARGAREQGHGEGGTYPRPTTAHGGLASVFGRVGGGSLVGARFPARSWCSGVAVELAASCDAGLRGWSALLR